ncbi:adenylyl cyclase X E-like isoform X2 [Drosophila novamexicana]|uniref:adenylyl cyclase X E-like isoform X2 n=1 Tax=Drosophila novamexicana TaxID=47314 RepID=UPI0011E600FC|nr:adenylyl cyclase X E-like isoform X2 [Drosophila novamexicana]
MDSLRSHIDHASMESDAPDNELAYSKSREWVHLRKKCKDLDMETCYKRYIQRLTVINLSLFLFIVELLFAMHILFQFVYSKCTVWVSMPYIVLMVLLPLILLICFKNKAQYKHFTLWNNLASCTAALLVTFIVSVLYILYFIVSSLSISEDLTLALHGCYVIYIISLNVLMEAFRIFMEYHLRQMLLRRHQLLHQNFLLKAAMQKEKDMMQTILPADIVDTLLQEIHKRIEDQRIGTHFLTPLILFIELHSDVSILVADMVNYTHLTTRMDVKEIVKFLHDIFVGFEQAAEKNEVLRIKFLGNSYTCVSGIQEYSRTHANSCLSLALDMINVMETLREIYGLNIDVRIAVHSGEVFTAIIGRIKWQYDIWSRDVDIAYRLELLGMPGKVHVSQTTLDFLHNEYFYDEGTFLAKEDPILQKANILTYLIGPQPRKFTIKTATFSYTSISEYSVTSLSHINSGKDFDTIDVIRKKTHEGMLEKVECMPVDGIQLARIFDFSYRIERGNEDYMFKPYISSFWRLFRHSEVEWNYINEPNLLLKYSLLIILFVGLLFLLQNLILPKTTFVSKLLLLLVSLMLICFFAFYKKIAIQFSKSPNTYEPKCFLNRCLVMLSELLEENLTMRICTYIICIIIIYAMATLNTVLLKLEQMRRSGAKSLPDDDLDRETFEPWEATQNVIMVFIAMFFVVVPLFFKAAIIVMMCILHILTVHTFYNSLRRVQTTNMGMISELASIWYILAFTLLVLIKEQHVTYLKTVSYHYKSLYGKKHILTEKSKLNAKIIMANILPSHVANLFLNRDASDELFCESYDKIAVLFATIVNFESEKTGLRVLNEYICLFDDLLAYYIHNFKVEKIKVTGWTYMAACGLKVDPEMDSALTMPLSTDRAKSYKKNKQKNLTEYSATFRAHQSRFTHPLLKHDDKCVLTLAHFAADLLRIMQDISILNNSMSYAGSMPGQLKIGISHGPAAAGVVGLSRPHYDIWGYTVNMASHLALVGVAGRIQVTEHTAITLERFDIKCEYHGITHAKIVGKIPMFLVDLDEDLNFQYMDELYLDSIDIVDADSQDTNKDNVNILYIDPSRSSDDDVKNKK